MRILFIAVVTLFLAGSGNLGPGGCGAPSSELPFRTLGDSQAWVVRKDEPAYFVVTDKNWKDYYAVLPVGADLANNFYVVVSWGIKPNPGYRISIMALRQVANTVQVAVNLEEPDPDKFYAQVLVRPIAVVEVSKKSLSGTGSLAFQFLDQKGNQLGGVEVAI